jgi:hypothetical protein
MRAGYEMSLFRVRGLSSLLLVISSCLIAGLMSSCGGSGYGSTGGSQAQTYTVSGTISGAGGNGATVTSSGAAIATATANSGGSYLLSGLGNGNYVVTPSNQGYSFTPANQAVAVAGANISAVNFTSSAAAPAYTISGTISPASAAAGAHVALSGTSSASSPTDANGNYSFTSLANGSYTVTPGSQTATFSPSSRSVTINNASVSAVNFTATAISSSNCGDTLNWTSAACQQIGAGSLKPQWTVISRHGEYAQDETECNIPSAITQAPGALSITTTASAYTCGNFNANGTIDQTPASWPYSTGDIQMNTFNFSPNGTSGSTSCAGTCNITIVGSMPSSSTDLWPAFWLLGSNCQDANKYSGDTGFDGCPNLGQSSYIEIDMVECYNSGGWCQFHVANPGFGIGNGCDASYSVDTNQHTFKTVWTPSSIQQYMDGTLETTCNQAIINPMFLIMQIQTGGAGGTPNNSQLPASMVVNSVTITNASGTAIFSDTFQ